MDLNFEETIYYTHLPSLGLKESGFPNLFPSRSTALKRLGFVRSMASPSLIGKLNVLTWVFIGCMSLEYSCTSIKFPWEDWLVDLFVSFLELSWKFLWNVFLKLIRIEETSEARERHQMPPLNVECIVFGVFQNILGMLKIIYLGISACLYLGMHCFYELCCFFVFGNVAKYSKIGYLWVQNIQKLSISKAPPSSVFKISST